MNTVKRSEPRCFPCGMPDMGTRWVQVITFLQSTLCVLPFKYLKVQFKRSTGKHYKFRFLLDN